MDIGMERSLTQRLMWGPAGAAGSALRNIVTYGDMLLRGRPSSGAPANVVATMAYAADVHALSSENEDEGPQNRRRAAGALLGCVSRVGVSTAYAAARTPSLPTRTGVMLGLVASADIPIVVTGNGGPRTWSGADWLSDLIPHLTFGLTSAAFLEYR